MTEKDFIAVKIGGMAGQGVKSAGLLFAKFAMRSGFHTYDYTEYPSLIRGGHNVMQVCVSTEPITSQVGFTDILVALNQETIDRHCSELLTGGGLLSDGEDNLDYSKLGEGTENYRVPLSKLAESAGGKELYINTVAVGSLAALLGGDLSYLSELIADEFADKGEKVISANKSAAEMGYKYILESYKGKTGDFLSPIASIVPRILINGNEAAALGAIAGGVQFAAIYPMSPISNILHVLASEQEKFGYIYKQPEDEISAVNMAIGASFAGARSMTATSGGGFCLMTEGYGLAGMTETPLVIINGMRGGPATGMPTWSEQGDLRFVLHAHQGDFPRIVLAAGDAEETFYLTSQAFNLADKYQTPVVILIDKNICENDRTFNIFDNQKFKIDRGKLDFGLVEDFNRYAYSPDGISLRSVPGSGNFFISNSDEHNTLGYSTEEIEERRKQMEKRMKKLETCAKEDMQDPVLYGPDSADLTIISWGSSKGPILQAIKNYNNVNYVHVTWMNPFPAQKVLAMLEKSKILLNIESNYTAQFGGLVREKTGIEIKDNLLKYDGRPFYPEEISEKIKHMIKEGHD